MLFYVVGMGEEGKDKRHPYLFLHRTRIEDSSVGLRFLTIGLLHNLAVQFEAVEKKYGLFKDVFVLVGYLNKKG